MAAPLGQRRAGEAEVLRVEARQCGGVGERLVDQRPSELAEAPGEATWGRADAGRRGGGEEVWGLAADMAGDLLAGVGVDRRERVLDERWDGRGDPLRAGGRIVEGQPLAALVGVAMEALADDRLEATAEPAGVDAEPTDGALAPQLLVGGEEDREVGPLGVQVAEAQRIRQALEVIAAVGQEIGLGLPRRAVLWELCHEICGLH